MLDRIDTLIPNSVVFKKMSVAAMAGVAAP
jgi:hypothetical protein